jgi:metal-responsive CopG/Arc/MetJ family transcriptional regulator
MGRPPLSVEGIRVNLEKEMVARIDALVSTYRRSKFIREAIEKELKRLEKRAAKEKG